MLEWVSRSAGKLDGFFQELGVETLAWKTAIDIGSSTWWFTQILLAHGIDSVTAVDVWTNQLHPSLRDDARVRFHENTDIREFTICTPVSIITIDVSFISLREIVPVLERFITPDADIYALYKPQFEVGREHLRKTWVPRDIQVVEKALSEFVEFLTSVWYGVHKVSKSIVIGEAGNQEYMMWLRADRE
jgi:23S rRNA (cytidine1920-2'-O)/16S rRNA (cytidine1409-2'-O)-methyltransferase